MCVSSLRKGHANLLRIVPILTDDPRRESFLCYSILHYLIRTFIGPADCDHGQAAGLRAAPREPQDGEADGDLPVSVTKRSPFAQAWATQASSRNCSPAPDLAL